MTVQTRTQLLTAADVIYSETTANANTANRVGQMFKDIIDSASLASEHPTATAVATSNLALSGTASTADSVALNTVGDVCLCTAQTSADENGPWVVQSGPWTRPDWFATGTNAGGFIIQVQEGTVYSDTEWECTTNDPSAVVDTNNLAWQLQGGATVNAGRAGLAPAVSATAGAVAYSTGSAQAYETTVRVGSGTFGVYNPAQYDPADGDAASIWVRQTGGTPGSGAYSTAIAFSQINSGRPGAAIAAVQTSADADQLGLAFFTHPSSSSTDVLAEVWRIDHGGNLIGLASGAYISVGATVASTGTVRGPAGFDVYGLDSVAANTRLIGIDGSDHLSVGGAKNDDVRSYVLNTLEFKVASGYVAVSSAGAAVASTGHVRGTAAFSGYGLNGSAANSRVWEISTNDLLLGDGTNITATKVYAASTVEWYIGAAGAGYFSSAGLRIQNQTDGADYLQLASGDTYSTLARRTNTGTPQEFLSASVTTLSLGYATGIATTSVIASTTAKTTIGAADIVEVTSTGVQVNAANLLWKNNVAGPTVQQSTIGNSNAQNFTLHAQNINISAGGPYTAGHLYLQAGQVAADTGAGTSSGGNVILQHGAYQATGLLTGATLGKDANGQFVSFGSGTVSTTGTHRVAADYLLKARAYDDDGDVSLLALSGASPNELTIGETADINVSWLKAKTYVAISYSGGQIAQFDSTGIELSNTLATPTIKAGALGAAAGKDLVVQAGDCNYGYAPGDLYLRAGDAGGSGAPTIYIEPVAAAPVITCQNATLSFFGGTVRAQQTRVGALTDSTGGTADSTVADVGASFNQATLNNNFADLIAKINGIEAVISAAGGGFGLTT